MSKVRLSKSQNQRLWDLLDDHPPAQLSQDLRNIYLEYLYHSNTCGVSIYFQRRLLAIQDLCNWFDLIATEIQEHSHSNQ